MWSIHSNEKTLDTPLLRMLHKFMGYASVLVDIPEENDQAIRADKEEASSSQLEELHLSWLGRINYLVK